MSATTSFLAVDLGASSGRLIDCRWNGNSFALAEVHRFANGGVRLADGLYWDALRIWSEIENGLRKFRAGSSSLPAGIGVDAWGVDFALLDRRGRLLGNPHHYRDPRTHGLPQALAARLSGLDLFRATGVQTMEINTVFQLAAMVRDEDARLASAHALLMIPDLFQFFLCGQMRAEFTETSTAQLLDPAARRWSHELLHALGIPTHIFKQIVLPGTQLGQVLPDVLAECGFPAPFPCIAVASHDTASAAAAIPDLDQESVFLSSGTWSLMGMTAAAANLSEEAFLGGFTNEGSATGQALLMKNLTGLWLLQECLRLWQAEGLSLTWPDLEEAARQAPAFRSFIDPSAPQLQAPADMRAAIAALCLASGQPVPATPGEFARCIFESLSLAYREVVESLARLTGRALRSVRVVGGGALNRFLCQMTADACARPVVAGPAEAAALGNALVQAVATGHIASLAQGQHALRASADLATYEPTQNDAWQQAFARYTSIVAEMRRATAAKF